MDEALTVVSSAMIDSLLNASLMGGVLLLAIAGGIVCYKSRNEIGPCLFLISGSLYFTGVAMKISDASVAIIPSGALASVVMLFGTILIGLIIGICIMISNRRRPPAGIKW